MRILSNTFLSTLRVVRTNITSAAVRENRWYLLVLLFVNLQLRCPRTEGMIGDDAFVLIFLAELVAQGDLTSWSISPFSPFGMYPFSSYPIGVPWLLSYGVTWISFDIMAVVFSYSMAMLGTYWAYRLGRELYKKDTMSIVFAGFYSLSGSFIGATYYTINARGSFLALLPLFLLFGLRYLRSGRLFDLAKSGAVFAIMLLVHGLTLLVGVYFLAGLSYKLSDVIKNRLSSLHKTLASVDSLVWYALVVDAVVCLAAVGLLTFTSDIQGLTPVQSIDVLTLFTVELSVIFYMALGLGLMSIAIPIGFFMSIRSSTSEKLALQFALLCLMLFIMPKLAYVRIIFLPLFAHYATIGFRAVQLNRRRHYFYCAAGILIIAYAIIETLTLHLSFWLAEAIVVTVVFAMLIILGNRTGARAPAFELNKRHMTSLFFALVILFSLVYTESTYSSSILYSSVEERQMIDTLLEDENRGLSYVYSHRLARRMLAYGIESVMALVPEEALYYGWITPDEIRSGTVPNFETLFSHGKPFMYVEIDPEWELWLSLTYLNITESEDLEAAKILGLEYIVVKRVSGEYSDIMEIQGAGMVHSPLLAATPSVCQVAFLGEQFTLFRLPTQ